MIIFSIFFISTKLYKKSLYIYTLIYFILMMRSPDNIRTEFEKLSQFVSKYTFKDTMRKLLKVIDYRYIERRK